MSNRTRFLEAWARVCRGGERFPLSSKDAAEMFDDFYREYPPPNTGDPIDNLTQQFPFTAHVIATMGLDAHRDFGNSTDTFLAWYGGSLGRSLKQWLRDQYDHPTPQPDALEGEVE